MNQKVRFYAVIVFILFMLSQLTSISFAQENDLDCVTELTTYYYMNLNWDRPYNQPHPPLRMAVEIASIYKTMDNTISGCGEIALNLVGTIVDRIDNTLYSPEEIATMYELIYQEIGEISIDEYHCAYDLAHHYLFSTDWQGVSVDLMATEAIEAFQATQAIADTQVSCDDDPYLSMTSTILFGGDFEVGDTHIIQEVYDIVSDDAAP
jgi:hypothetical protein